MDWITNLQIRAKFGETTAAVQVGVTLLGTLAAALSGAGAVRQLAPLIASVPGLARYAEEIAVGMVVVALSYFSLVAGELIPKRLALRNAEGMAMLLAGPLYFWSRLVYVPSRLLAASTDLALRVLGVKQLPKATTSQQEVELIIRQGAADGVFEPAERRLYKTLAGFVLHRVGRIPTAGDRFVLQGFVITVSEMDRLRVAWVQIAPAAPPNQPAGHRAGRIVGLA